MKLRDLGNSLIVVEHDEDTMRAADCIVDIGPGAGEHGGQLVAMGTAEDLMKNEDSITGAYLSGKLKTRYLWRDGSQPVFLLSRGRQRIISRISM